MKNFSKINYHKYCPLALILLFAMLLGACARKQENKKIIHGIDDLKGEKVAVLMGSTHDQFLVDNYPTIELFHLEGSPDVVPALLSGQVDAALLDGSLAYSVQHEVDNFVVVGDPVFNEEYGLGFSDENLRNEFNELLREKQSSGELAALIKKWEDDYETAEMPVFENNGENGTLHIGTSIMTPFVLVRNNEFVGIEAELLYEFAARKKMIPDIKNYGFAAVIAGVATKKLDIICCAITITEERAKQMFFSDAFYTSPARLLVNKARTANTVSFTPSTRVGVLLGSSSDEFISQKYPECDIKRLGGSHNLVTDLLHNGCDLIVLDEVNQREVRKNHPTIVPVQDSVFACSLHIVAAKDNQALINDVNLFLEEMKQSGELEALVKRWKSDINTPMPVIENSEKNGTLLIATSAETPPYNFIRDGQLVGIDVELATRFAAYLGKKPQFMQNDFVGVLTSVTSNKADVGISYISRTDERAKQMCFSEPYCDTQFGVYALKNAQSESSWWQDLKNSFYNNLVKEQRYLLILNGLKATLLISLLSIFFGTILAAVVCFAKMSKSKILHTTATIYIDVLRGVPQVVLLMIMFYVVFAASKIDGVWVAAITFALNFSAYVAEIFRTAIEGVDKGQAEAGVAMGFSQRKTFRLIVAPQAIKRAMPVFKGEIISLVKMTSIVGYIAVQDLTKAGDIIRSRTFDAFFPLIFVALLYFAISWLLTALLSLTDKKN